jgi:nucleoside-diphosphate-sugar epimerase
MSIWLVTGGAGFIGSHLAETLVGRGQQVRIVDNLVTGRRDNVPANAEFVEGDLTDPQVARQVVAGVDVVLHQAALPSVSLSIRDPATSHRANVDGTLNLLLAARDAGVRRVVYAASSSAYGDTPTLPKHEGMPADPKSPYALQKHIGEQYGQIFSRLYGLDTVTIRYFNVFGPRQQPSSPYSGVISLFVKAALEGTAPTVYGDGLQTRDFTYIDNVVDGVLKAADSPAASGEIINVASGGRVSLLEVWETLGRLVGPTKAPVFDRARESDIRDSQADISKAARLLAYAPTVTFEDGLARTVTWLQATACL